MSMTVRQLIKELKGWPQDWKVATAAHDNSEDEIQGLINGAIELEEGRAKNDYGPMVVLCH